MQTYLLFVDFLLVKQQYVRMIQSTISTMNRRKATKEPDIRMKVNRSSESGFVLSTVGEVSDSDVLVEVALDLGSSDVVDNDSDKVGS